MNVHQQTIINGSVFDAASTTQKNALGQFVRFSDGSAFVYVSSAVDIEPGELCSQPAATALQANKLAAASAGATSLTLTLAGVTADEYAEGLIFMTDDTGQGYRYRIKENTATASGTTTITLKDPLIAAVDTTTDCILRKFPYKNVVLGTASTLTVGAAVVQCTAFTDSTTEYFWAQCHGLCSVFVKTATSISEGVAVAAGADGGIVVATATNHAIGYAAGAVDDWTPVDLRINAGSKDG